MDDTTTRTRPATPATERLPWPSLLVLGAATLAMVAAEMLPTAVLGPMSDGLGVPESDTAQLVSLWAAMVVLASFPLVRLTAGRDRRTVIALGLLVLAGSSVLTALAPTISVATAGRLVGATAVGLLWATVNAHVADLVSDRLLGSAVAVVLGGATLGMVLGTPAARLVSDLVGWRAAFVSLAVFTAVVALGVRLAVTRPRHRADAESGTATEDAGSLAATLSLTGLVALVLVGHYGAYTFVTRLAEAPANLLPGGLSTLLLWFGLSSALGVAAAGRLTRHNRVALVVTVALTALALLALAGADSHPSVGLAVVGLWGVASGALPPLAQTEILRVAGPSHRTMAGALIPVLFNGGIAVGAGLAALAVARGGVGALPVPAAAVVAIAAAGLAWLLARLTMHDAHVG